KKFFVVSSNPASEMAVTTGAFDEVFNMSDDDLSYYLHTLYYIGTNTERSFANALTTVEEKKNFFFNFWSKRLDKEGQSPAKPWLAYKSRVDYANKHFKAAHLEGWRTDRGRIMLTYGAPNDIEREPSSNTKYPYHIWRYNKIKTQPNVRFIFYNPNLAIEEWVMLHSDLRGEHNNPRWEFEVVRTVQDGNLDNDNVQGKWR
ncbi:MAG: GWxTD domain-containing protein, partial [Bacteroidota bacterium]